MGYGKEVVIGEIIPEDRHWDIKKEKEMDTATPRSFMIRRSDLDKHGLTSGCNGCMGYYSGDGGDSTVRVNV